VGIVVHAPWIAKLDDELVEIDVIHDLDARHRREPRRERRRVTATALDEIGDPAATELAKRGPQREPASTARELGRVIEWIRHDRVAGQVLGAAAERPAMSLCIANERDPAVVRRVEPFMCVGRPRVGGLRAIDERATSRRDARPQTERAVEVHPHGPSRLRLTDRTCDRDERIEATAVDVARLRTHDERCGPREIESLGAHPAVAIGVDHAHLLGAEPEHAKRLVDRAVALGTDDDLDRRRAREPVRLDVPAHGTKHLGACDCKADEARHLRTGDERTGLRGHLEELGDPAQHDVLDRRSRRRAFAAPRVLIPHRRQPIGRDRRRKPTADHPAEEPPARHRTQPRVDGARELVDHRARIARRIGQRPIERVEHRGGVAARRDRPLRQAVEKARREIRGVLEERLPLGASHLPTVTDVGARRRAQIVESTTASVMVVAHATGRHRHDHQRVRRLLVDDEQR